MNESALNALINLFAIFSAREGIEYDNARKNIEDYLSRRLGIRETGEYISLFFEIYELYSLNPSILSGEKLSKLISQICQQLKSKIPHSEQVIVFLHFLELAPKGNGANDDRFYRLVSEFFEISLEDYNSYKRFIYSEDTSSIDDSRFLLINNRDADPGSKALHIRENGISGEILVFYLSDINQFVFKYFGPDVLMIEGTSIREGHFYSLGQGSIIRGLSRASIYYSDISLKYSKNKQQKPIQFSGKDVTYFFPGSNNGVQRFTFSESSGQMIAVMGGSGVGKSTLLNVLNGTLPPASGKITINDLDINSDYAKIEGLIGYIPQDDLVISELTVFQNVYYNARLCLDKVDKNEILMRVNKLLADLDLYEMRDMVVGSPLKKTLSGGQRKRLNIALELIREPSILFVDEPTSGLSSRDSERIMVLLKEQANQGRLVIVNIHQPSSFIYKLFDKLWIMDKGGYPVYAGNPIDALVYFKELANHIDSDTCECPTCGSVNPEQVLEIIEDKNIDASGKLTETRRFQPEELYGLYVRNIQEKVQLEEDSGQDSNNEKPEVNFNKPGKFKQFKIFSLRNLKSKLSNTQYVLINILQAPLLALVVSFLTRYAGEEGYYFGMNKNFPSFVFMSVVVMLFQGMSLSAEEIIRDRAILQRESFLRLSRFSYLNSKIIFLLFVSALQSFLFTATSFLVLGMSELFFNYWLILFLTAAFANLAGLVISAGLNSVVTIYISIPLLIIPQILLCGLIVPFEDLKSKKSTNNFVPWVGDMMVSRWAFEAITVDQFINNEYTAIYYDIDKEMRGYFIKGELITPEVGNIAQSVSFDIAAGKGSESLERRLKMIRDEVIELDSDSLINPFPIDLLYENRFNPHVNDSLQSHLSNLRELYKQLRISTEKYKDKLTNSIIAEIGEEGLLDLKKKKYNTALGKLLSRENPADMIEQGSRAIRVKLAPVYRNPESTIGRAHFYAPFKQIGDWRIATMHFNSMIIFLMTIALFIALYFNWLGSILNAWDLIKRKYARRNS